MCSETIFKTVILTRINSRSGIGIHQVVKKVSSRNKPILRNMSYFTELGFQGQNIHGDQSLIQSVLTRQRPGVLRSPNDFMYVSLVFPFGRKPTQSVIETRGEGLTRLNFQINF